METKKIIVSGSAVLLVFLGLSSIIRDTEVIWYQIRLLGIISYASFFTTIIIGELRMLHKNKAEFQIFRYHKAIAVFSIYLVVLHLSSAIIDNYGRGKMLGIASYLGLSFSDSWLSFLSFGTLAFYLMLLIGITSRTGNIQRLGFRNWKKIHYSSYVAFIMAYTHAINIGTDLKTGIISYGLRPLFIISFFVVASLLLVRIMSGLNLLSDQAEINLALAFSLILVLGTVFSIGTLSEKAQALEDLSVEKEQLSSKISLIETDNSRLVNETKILSKVSSYG